jgi:hypothetical protein
MQGRISNTPVSRICGNPRYTTFGLSGVSIDTPNFRTIAWIFVRPNESVGVNEAGFDEAALRSAIESEADHDTVVTTGGSSAGERPVARARLRRDANATLTVEPIRTSGAGVMSSIAPADGWVEKPASREGISAGELVPVQQWEPVGPRRGQLE